MTRVLVTGASGFLGGAVIMALAAEGYTIRAAVRSVSKRSFGDGVEVIQHADLTQLIDWRPLVEGMDTVIHLAGIAHTGRSASPELYDRVNRQASEELALAAARAGVSRFIFISSVRAQSGPAANHVLTERDPAVPTDAYGRSKLAAEAAIRTAGLPFTILRPVLVYGPAAGGNFALLSRAAASPFPLPVRDFTNRRSLLGIANFLSALGFVLASRAAINESYLVADPGMAPTLPEIVATLRQAQRRRPRLLHTPPGLIEMLLRALRRGDLWDRIGGTLQVDPGKLIAAGWQPLHDTRAGLQAMAQKHKPLRAAPHGLSSPGA